MFRRFKYLAIIAILVLFTACEERIEYKPFDIIEVSFLPFIEEEKTLVAIVDTDIAYYTYIAEPLFSLSSGGLVYGGTEGAEKDLGPTGKESAGRFTQGKWYFHVFAYNEKGELVRDGECIVYLSKNATTGLKNTVPITLYRTSLKTGSIHFAFTTTAVSSSLPYVRVTPIRQGEVKATRTFYATSVNEDETATFNFTISGLQSGVWEFRLETYDNSVKEGGGAVSTYILGDGTTEVTGTIYPSEWIDAGFAIEMPDPVEGTIGSDVSTRVGNVSFSWTSLSGIPVTYSWYVDGSLASTTTTSSWSKYFSKPGVYSVTCIATDEGGLEKGYSTITVTVQGDNSNRLSFSYGGNETTITKTLPQTINGTPLVRVHIEDPNGVILCSGYPTLTQSSGVWTGKISFIDPSSTNDGEAQIEIKNGTITVKLSKVARGTVTVGVSV